MTRFCDNCERNDHESCMIEIEGENLCRRCQVFCKNKNLVFKCKCRTWNTDLLQAKCCNSHQELMCYKCDTKIFSFIEDYMGAVGYISNNKINIQEKDDERRL